MSTFSKRSLASSPALFALADIERFDVGDGKEVVYSRATRTSGVFRTSSVERVLLPCKSFETLAAHAEAVCQGLGLTPDKRDTLTALLEDFAAAGCLVSNRAALAGCVAAADPEDAPARISTVGFVTRDRIPTLERGLTSFIENRQAFGGSHGFAVLDDSPSAATRQGYRDMLRTLSARYAVDVRYGGREEKEAYAARLSQRGGFDPALVAFALFGPDNGEATYGANRNALLLDTVGEQLISADDDSVCRITPSPHAGDGVSLTAQPFETWFFPDPQATLRATAEEERDVVALHGQLLGRDVGSYLSQLDAEASIDLDRLSGPLATGLRTHGARVLATLTGTVGDSGADMATPLLFSTGATRERLLGSEAACESAFTSRQVHHGVGRLTINEGTFFRTTTTCGLDNRRLLPPFFPVYRGEEVVFAEILSRCFTSCVGYLPWALWHSPPEPRAFSLEAGVPRRSRPEGMLVAEWVKRYEPAAPPGEPGERLRGLGRHFVGLASLPAIDFEEALRVVELDYAAGQLRAFQKLLAHYKGSPGFWAQRVERAVETLRARTNAPLPAPESGGWDVLVRRVMQFGELLQAWPDLVEVARDLRERDEALTYRP